MLAGVFCVASAHATTIGASLARAAAFGWTCHLAFKWTVDQSAEKDTLLGDEANKAAQPEL